MKLQSLWREFHCRKTLASILCLSSYCLADSRIVRLVSFVTSENRWQQAKIAGNLLLPNPVSFPKKWLPENLIAKLLVRRVTFGVCEWPWGSGKRQLVLTLMHDVFGELEAETTSCTIVTAVRNCFLSEVKFPKRYSFVTSNKEKSLSNYFLLFTALR